MAAAAVLVAVVQVAVVQGAVVLEAAAAAQEATVRQTSVIRMSRSSDLDSLDLAWRSDSREPAGPTS
jgi:hypothetical protein